MLREAVNLLQPLLAGKTLLEGNFRWMCASLMPLGGCRSVRSVRCFCAGPTCSSTCRSSSNTASSCWTRPLSTPGAGRKAYFLAGYLLRRPGGGPWCTRTRLGACSVRGQWEWPGRAYHGWPLGGVFAQRALSASYYGVYPSNSPKNLPPLEACMSNSKVRNSNVSC